MDFRHQQTVRAQQQAQAAAQAQQAAGPPVLVRPLPTPHSSYAPSTGSSSAFSGASRTSSYATTPSEDGQLRRPSGPLEQMRGSYRTKDPSTASSHVSPTHPQPPQRAPSPLPPLPAAYGHHPRQPSAPNLAPPRSPTSPITPGHTLTFSPRSMLTPLPPGSFVTATKDHETYSYVDLAACTSPAALRETVLTKLQIQDDEFLACEFFQTRIGGGKGAAPERRIANDDELWDSCWKAGDAGYTVFVKMRYQAAPDHLPTGASAAGGGRQAYPYPGGGAQSPTAAGPGPPTLHRRRKSASVSSKSDLSSPFSPVGGPGEYAGTGRTSPQVNEFGEVVLGAHAPTGPGTGSGGRGERVQSQGWSQPPPSGHGHRASGSISSIGGLAAPDQRPRAGSLTPTAPAQEDYVWVEDPRRSESMRRPSMGQLQPMQKQGGPPPPMPPSSQSSQGSHGVVMLPSGPIRRLPGPPQPLQHHSYAPSDHEPPPQERRQRTQTAPGSVAGQAGPPPPMPTVSVAGWRPPSAHYQPPQPVRPLPSTNPGHPNFNIVSTPSAQYHNLALQDRDAFRHHHAAPPASPQQQQTYFAPNPAPPTLGPPRQVMVTKSADNLREHYAHAFDSDLRPKPPSGPPVPPQYRPPPIGSYSGGPPRPPQYPMPPNTQQQYSPQPPQNRGPPPNRGGPPPQARQPSAPQSQPSYPPVNQPYKGFDISVMRPTGPPSSTSLPAGNHTLPMRNAQRPATSNGPYASPILNQAPPPHGWQQQQHHGPSPPRRPTNEWSPRPQDRAYPQGVARFPGPPPPNLPDVSGGIPLHPGEILQHSHPRRPSDRERDAHSPTSPLARPPPNASLMMANDPTWAAEEMRRSQTYSHPTAYGPEAVPARREASASGVDGSRRRSEGSRDREQRRLSRENVPSSLQPGGKERDSGSSTGSLGWKPTNRVQQPQDGAYDGLQDESAVYNSPPSSASARSSTSASGPITPITNVGGVPMTDAMWAEKAARQEAMHAAGPGALPMIAGSDIPTPGGDDWTVFLNTFNKAPDGEATITSTDSATLKPAPSTKPTTPVTPTSAEPTLTPFSPYEDDDDEEESATYLPGFGPTRTPSAPVTPSATVGFALSDQPTSRSPATERRPRLPQLIINDSASASAAAAGAADAPASGDLKSAESERSTSQLRRPSAVQKRSQHFQSQSSSDNSPIVRRGSFADREKRKSDWAFRPKVEDVLENLEVFFPKHELDKEVFDAPVPTPATPSPTASPAKEAPPQPIPAPLKRVGATGLGYKKSIRVVAGDRRGNMLKASAREKHAGDAAPASVMRRKSTKLFGSRLEEVTPAQMKQMDVDTIAEAPVDDPDNFSFKWIKGELIGRGSYGKVYIAFNVTAGEAIAVKQVELPSTMSDKEDLRIQGMVASLKAEIELLKDLAHDNIVEYLGMEETPEHLSIFLEYVPGGSVGRMIRTHGKFPEDVIKHFTFQILTGLRYLHNLGILHRDLKGDNILCDQDGVCKISDFGTSKKSQDIYNNDANMSMQGSIFWMAPEVIQNNQQGYSAKADIWSLGCLCLEMFAGRRPWDKKEVFETMFKLGAERLAPPVPEDVILSELAKAFFSACFQGDPDMRPRADQLMRHRFLELSPDYAFTKTTLYRAIASKGDDVHTPSP